MVLSDLLLITPFLLFNSFLCVRIWQTRQMPKETTFDDFSLTSHQNQEVYDLQFVP